MSIVESWQIGSSTAACNDVCAALCTRMGVPRSGTPEGYAFVVVRACRHAEPTDLQPRMNDAEHVGTGNSWLGARNVDHYT